ncbi:MAG: HAD family phosphatase [Erysipelotrichaceae bacterium]|nr:HAD family phosphatase [Erysipelotrichaceae bacterium]
MEKIKDLKLIVSDIDGTLINSKSECTPRTVNAIAEARKKGIKFALCSGRPISGIKPLLKEWNLEDNCDYIVGMNGGEILNWNTNRHVLSYTLDEETVKELIKLYEDEGHIASYYDDTGLHVSRMSEDVERVATRTATPVFVNDINEMTKGPQSKLMIIVKPELMEEVEAFYEKTKDDRYIGFKTAIDLFEMNNPLLAKDIGVKVIATQMGIELDDILAFGDTSNDVAMLEEVGHSVCMSNGSEDAKEAAKYIGLSCDEDAVAVFIEDNVL